MFGTLNDLLLQQSFSHPGILNRFTEELEDISVPEEYDTKMAMLKDSR